MKNSYFPGKKQAKRSGIIMPYTAKDMLIFEMPRRPSMRWVPASRSRASTCALTTASGRC